LSAAPAATSWDRISFVTTRFDVEGAAVVADPADETEVVDADVVELSAEGFGEPPEHAARPIAPVSTNRTSPCRARATAPR